MVVRVSLFYIFVDKSDRTVVARPESIRCREADEKLARIHRASPVSKEVDKLSSVSGTRSGANYNPEVEGGR